MKAVKKEKGLKNQRSAVFNDARLVFYEVCVVIKFQGDLSEKQKILQTLPHPLNEKQSKISMDSGKGG